jgi:hypothetical protein
MRVVLLILLVLVLGLFAAGVSGCVETTATRTLEDGMVITEKRRDFDRETKHFIGDAVRHRLRMPPREEERERSGK